MSNSTIGPVDYTFEETDLIVSLLNQGFKQKYINSILQSKGYHRTEKSLTKKIQRLRKRQKKALSQNDNIVPPTKFTPKDYFNAIKLTANKIYKDRNINNEVVAEKNKKNQTLCVVLSDLHIGKKTKYNGEEVYNLQIANQNFEALTKNFMDIYNGYITKEADIDEIVVALVGDIIDGELIYDTQHAHIDANVVQQLLKATTGLFDFIQKVADINPKVPVKVACVKGNHGRINHEASEESNYDLSLYYQLQFIFAEVLKKDNVYFEISDGDYNVFEAKGHRVLMRHQVPKESSNAIARAKFGGWYEQHNWNIMLTGHYHSMKLDEWNNKPIFYNGSMCGTDDLAERLSYNNTPKQWVFGISNHRPVTFMYKIDTVR